jgi:signal transduction histidine kinase
MRPTVSEALRGIPEAREAVEADNLALGDAAECGSPMAHEMNNFLNSLLLHIAVLEAQLPAEQRQGLEQIRREAKVMAALVHQWQNYRRRPQGDAVCDLNQVLQAAVQASNTAVQMELSDGPVSVRGRFAELLRLGMFLVRNAAAVTPPGGGVTLHTARREGKGVLSVGDTGPSVAPEQLGELFAPFPTRREGTNGLELAACKSIVRRLGGTIAAEDRPGGGVEVTVELQGAPEGK